MASFSEKPGRTPAKMVTRSIPPGSKTPRKKRPSLAQITEQRVKRFRQSPAGEKLGKLQAPQAAMLFDLMERMDLHGRDLESALDRFMRRFEWLSQPAMARLLDSSLVRLHSKEKLEAALQILSSPLNSMDALDADSYRDIALTFLRKEVQDELMGAKSDHFSGEEALKDEYEAPRPPTRLSLETTRTCVKLAKAIDETRCVLGNGLSEEAAVKLSQLQHLEQLHDNLALTSWFSCWTDAHREEATDDADLSLIRRPEVRESIHFALGVLVGHYKAIAPVIEVLGLQFREKKKRSVKKGSDLVGEELEAMRKLLSEFFHGAETCKGFLDSKLQQIALRRSKGLVSRYEEVLENVSGVRRFQGVVREIKEEVLREVDNCRFRFDVGIAISDIQGWTAPNHVWDRTCEEASGRTYGRYELRLQPEQVRRIVDERNRKEKEKQENKSKVEEASRKDLGTQDIARMGQNCVENSLASLGSVTRKVLKSGKRKWKVNFSLCPPWVAGLQRRVDAAATDDPPP